MVGDGERVAIAAIAKLELPFEIHTRQMIWILYCEKCGALRPLTRAVARLNHIVPVDNGVNGAHRWPFHIR